MNTLFFPVKKEIWNKIPSKNIPVILSLFFREEKLTGNTLYFLFQANTQDMISPEEDQKTLKVEEIVVKDNDISPFEYTLFLEF